MLSIFNVYYMVRFALLCIALFFGFVAIKLRTPLLASIRTELFWVVLVMSLGLIVWECRNLRKISSKLKIIISFLLLEFYSGSLAIALTKEIQFSDIKQKVLTSDVQQLENLGQHFIIGYTNFAEIKTLVEKRAIGGVFITHWNVKNKSEQEISAEIKSLQSIRLSQGLPRLWIATDQEGGTVSRLSPPLTQLPPLSKIVANQPNIDRMKEEVIKYATQQGKELARIGINLNFAPVVDINKGIINPEDRISRIYERGISKDKEIVAKVAIWYCSTIAKFGVRCTIKHFPGLGRVKEDTHILEAELDTPITELLKDDWIPFRTVMKSSEAFTMLGHVKLTALDPLHPVSFSESVVKGLIRDDWQHEGVLITDDFCMLAVFNSKDGIKNAPIKAINAGVDLILISYDPSVYYPAILALLKADEQNIIDKNSLSQSKKRIQKNLKSLTAKKV